jgi:hypothetical protein
VAAPHPAGGRGRKLDHRSNIDVEWQGGPDAVGGEAPEGQLSLERGDQRLPVPTISFLSHDEIDALRALMAWRPI